ncbi:MAG TPA: hypothetical protein VGN69_02985 [Solirubrobacteraceae bacterium]|jgi:hypothetical protein|nr:hypothetical protein [Solirubrobacteraceae bacterium]
MAATSTRPTGEEQRAQALIAMGFTTTQALLLAATQDAGEHVDLERLRRMLSAGCAHEVALRIVL